MDRVIITRCFCGLCHMQVCAVSDATDEEILRICNALNPSGTSLGWSKVIRKLEEGDVADMLPVPCDDDKNRTHFLVQC